MKQLTMPELANLAWDIQGANNIFVDTVIREESVQMDYHCERYPENADTLIITEADARAQTQQYIPGFLLGHIKNPNMIYFTLPVKNDDIRGQERSPKRTKYRMTFTHHKESHSIYGKIKQVQEEVQTWHGQKPHEPPHNRMYFKTRRYKKGGAAQ